MNSKADFPRLLQAFFTERLMRQRQASPHTIASYRNAFRLLVSDSRKALNPLKTKSLFFTLSQT